MGPDLQYMQFHLLFILKVPESDYSNRKKTCANKIVSDQPAARGVVLSVSICLISY